MELSSLNATKQFWLLDNIKAIFDKDSKNVACLQTFVVDNIEYDLMTLLLKFIYTDKVGLFIIERAIEVYVAAIKYRIPRLKDVYHRLFKEKQRKGED